MQMVTFKIQSDLAKPLTVNTRIFSCTLNIAIRLECKNITFNTRSRVFCLLVAIVKIFFDPKEEKDSFSYIKN